MQRCPLVRMCRRERRGSGPCPGSRSGDPTRQESRFLHVVGELVFRDQRPWAGRAARVDSFRPRSNPWRRPLGSLFCKASARGGWEVLRASQGLHPPHSEPCSSAPTPPVKLRSQSSSEPGPPLPDSCSRGLRPGTERVCSQHLEPMGTGRAQGLKGQGTPLLQVRQPPDGLLPSPPSSRMLMGEGGSGRALV